MKKLVIACAMLLGLSGCVAYAPSPYAEPYPGYYGGYAYDYYPYAYYYGFYGGYPAYYNNHRHYNWGYWHGDGHRRSGGRGRR